MLINLKQKYSEVLDGVDMHGCDSTGAAQQVKDDKRVFAGIQILEVLKLRTCVCASQDASDVYT